VLRQWLNIIAAHVPVHPELIVDLGCGTGGRDSPVGFYLDSFDYAGLKKVLLDPLGPGGSRDNCGQRRNLMGWLSLS